MALFSEDTAPFVFDFADENDDDDEMSDFGSDIDEGITDVELGDLVALGVVSEEDAGMGGQKTKQRNLMLRYGVAHHKHIKEAHQLSYQSKETEPRSVANALLQRLRSGDDEIRLMELREAFFKCIKQDKKKAWTSLQGTHRDIEEISADEIEEIAKAAFSIPGAKKDMANLLEAVPETPMSENDTQREDRVRQALRELKQEDLEKAQSQVRNLEAKNDLHMQVFVRGMSAFFQALEAQDKKRQLQILSRTKQAQQSEVEEELSEERRRVSLMGAMDDINWDDDPQSRRGSGDSAIQPGAISGDNISLPLAIQEVLSEGATSPKTEQRSGEQDANDFIQLGKESTKLGFEMLFRAVDCNNTGAIEWDSFLRYLMEASLLGRVGARELETKNYELLHTHYTTLFHDLVRVQYIQGKDQFLIGARDVAFIGNSRNHPARCIIPTPTDPITQALNYRTITVECLPFCQVVAVSYTDSTVKFFHVPGARGRLLKELRFNMSQTAMMFHPDKHLFFIGSREGEVVSYSPRYSASKGLTLHKVQSGHHHDDAISTIVQVTTEQSIITGSFDKTICILDARRLVLLRRLIGHESAVLRVAHSPDFNAIVSVSFDQIPFVWLVALKDNPPLPLQDIAKPHIGHVVAVEMLSGTKNVATLCSKGVCKIWDLRNMQCQQTMHLFSQHYSPDRGFKFHALSHMHEAPSGTNPLGLHRLYAFTRRRIFALEYNLSQRNAVLRNTADDEPILAVVYSHSEGIYVTASISLVRIWDEVSSAIRDTFKCPMHAENGGISCLSLHPDGRMYFTGTRNGSIFARNISTGTIVHCAIGLHTNIVTHIQFCPGHINEKLKGFKGGLGDVVVSIADDYAMVQRSDFTLPFNLTEMDHPRCIDFDGQSSTIVVGDSGGSLNLVPLEILSTTRSYPQMKLSIPKPTRREITAVKVLPSLSLFVAADDEGHIGLFSLRYHSAPYTCMRVWCHASDSMTPPTVTSFGLYSRKAMLYVGDDVGFVTVYDLREALHSMHHSAKTAAVKRLLMRTPAGQSLLKQAEESPQTTPQANNPLGLPTSQNRTPRQKVMTAAVKGISPKPFSLEAPPVFSGGTSPFETPKMASQGTPRDRFAKRDTADDSPLASPRVPLAQPTTLSPGDANPSLFTPNGENLQAPASLDKRLRGGQHLRRKADTGVHLQMVAAAAVTKHQIDYSQRIVSIVNRWRAHDDPVTSIELVDSEKEDHLVLLTSGADQCVCGWKLSGSVYIGALEQYGRSGIALTKPSDAMDFDQAVEYRRKQKFDAKRDETILRAKGLLRLAGTRMLPCIPKVLEDELTLTTNRSFQLSSKTASFSLQTNALTSARGPPLFAVTVDGPDAGSPKSQKSLTSPTNNSISDTASFSMSPKNSTMRASMRRQEMLKPRKEIYYALVPHSLSKEAIQQDQNDEDLLATISRKATSMSLLSGRTRRRSTTYSVVDTARSRTSLRSRSVDLSSVDEAGSARGVGRHRSPTVSAVESDLDNGDFSTDDDVDGDLSDPVSPHQTRPLKKKLVESVPYLENLRATQGTVEEVATAEIKPALKATADSLPTNSHDPNPLLAYTPQRNVFNFDGTDKSRSSIVAAIEHRPIEVPELEWSSSDAQATSQESGSGGHSRFRSRLRSRAATTIADAKKREGGGGGPLGSPTSFRTRSPSFAPSSSTNVLSGSSFANIPILTSFNVEDDGEATLPVPLDEMTVSQETPQLHPEPDDPEHLVEMLPKTFDGKMAARSLTVLARQVRTTLDSIFVPEETPAYCVFSNQLPHEIAVDDVVALPPAERETLQKQLYLEQVGSRSRANSKNPSPMASPGVSPLQSPGIQLLSIASEHDLERALNREASSAVSDVLRRRTSPPKKIDLKKYRTVMNPPPPKPMPGLWLPPPKKPRPGEFWKKEADAPDPITLKKKGSSLQQQKRSSRFSPIVEQRARLSSIKRSSSATPSQLVTQHDLQPRKSKKSNIVQPSGPRSSSVTIDRQSFSLGSTSNNSFYGSPAIGGSGGGGLNVRRSVTSMEMSSKSRAIDQFVLQPAHVETSTVSMASMPTPSALKPSASSHAAKALKRQKYGKIK